MPLPRRGELAAVGVRAFLAYSLGRRRVVARAERLQRAKRRSGLRVGQPVHERVTHAAACTLRAEYSAFGELDKIALSGCGTDVIEVRVPFVGYFAKKATGESIEQNIEGLPLSLV